MEKLHLRYGIDTDRVDLQKLLAENDMHTEIEPAEFLLAVSAGDLIGTARLEREQGSFYLRSVVVDANWQGQGVGRLLIHELSRGLPELSVVSRGQSAGFYKKMGFEPIPWTHIPNRYREECAVCEDRETCQPVPMILYRHGTR